MTYRNANKYLLSAPPESEKAATAERMRLLLSALGNPQKKLRIIPVLGGKGKSSCIRMLASTMRHSGISSGTLTYPILPLPRDNITLSETPLTPEHFASLTALLASTVKALEITPTQSELLFCLALHASVEQGCRYLLVESTAEPGDPTAIIPPPPLAVITSAPESRIAEISAMIRPGIREVVSAPLSSAAYRTVSDACAKAGCRLTVPASSSLQIRETSLRRTTFTYRGTSYTIPLYGRFSVLNALVTIESADALSRIGCKITDSGRKGGLLASLLPARGEFLSVHPTVLIDAADTPEAIQALAELLLDKGTSVGRILRICFASEVKHSFLTPLRTLEASGFASSDPPILLPTDPTEQRRAVKALLADASNDTLILIIGALPFTLTARETFLRALSGT